MPELHPHPKRWDKTALLGWEVPDSQGSRGGASGELPTFLTGICPSMAGALAYTGMGQPRESECQPKAGVRERYEGRRGLPSVSAVKNLPAMQETRVWSLDWEDPLEEGMATHSSILAGKIPRTEESGGLQSMGSQRAGHDWSDWAHACMREGAICPGRALLSPGRMW